MTSPGTASLNASVKSPCTMTSLLRARSLNTQMLSSGGAGARADRPQGTLKLPLAEYREFAAYFENTGSRSAPSEGRIVLKFSDFTASDAGGRVGGS